jgi:hypothetical protein
MPRETSSERTERARSLFSEINDTDLADLVEQVRTGQCAFEFSRSDILTEAARRLRERK